MRSSYIAIAATSAALLTGCAQSIDVHTMASPNASLSNMRTFRILPGPARRDGAPPAGSDDPMINNSIANRALRAALVRSLEAQGYTLDEQNPDFGVAFYATARETLDVTVWDYGYPFWPGWGWGRYGRPEETLTPYTQGTVIVDIINPVTRELVWRGDGKAELSDDATENAKQLSNVASAVAARVPAATRPVAFAP